MRWLNADEPRIVHVEERDLDFLLDLAQELYEALRSQPGGVGQPGQRALARYEAEVGDPKHKGEQQGARDGLSEGATGCGSVLADGASSEGPLAESVQKGEQPRCCCVLDPGGSCSLLSRVCRSCGSESPCTTAGSCDHPSHNPSVEQEGARDES